MDPNRIVELNAMIGAIGEQAVLCWGFEQDAQRPCPLPSVIEITFIPRFLAALPSTVSYPL
jgi:hypothetical protein